MEFPRPPSDNGIGLHDDGNAGNNSLGFMHNLIDAMADKNFKWLKILATVDVNKVELARHCRQKGIMPIVRPYEQEPHPKSRVPDWFVRGWVDAGCPYIEVWNEPNLRCETNKEYKDYTYAGGKTGVPAFAELLLDQWLTNADTIRRNGGIPLFPAMSPTGYTGGPCILHHELYSLVLESAKNRGILEWAFENAGVAVHNRPCNGMPLDKSDKCAFSDYLWVQATFQKYLNREIPLFGTESGYEGGMITDWFKNQENLLNPTPEQCLQKHRELNHEIFLRMNPNHPKAWKSYLMCQCMWLAVDGAWHGAGWAHNGWANGAESYAWKHMNDIAPFTRTGTAPQPATKAEGIDVSQWQGEIDWQKVASNKRFAFIRASIGTSRDPKYRANADASKGLLLRGVYHYLKSTIDPLEQARAFWATIQNDVLELPPMLDVEDEGLTEAKVKAFADEFKRISGKGLGVYTSVWKWNDQFNINSTCGLNPLWVAHWTEAEKPTLPLAWKEWEFWQYTSNGSVNGITGRVDLNRFNGTVAQLEAKYSQQPTPEPGGNTVDFDGLSPEMIATIRIMPAPSAMDAHWKVTRIEVQPTVDHQSAFAVIPEGQKVKAIFSWSGGQHVAEPKADPYAPIGAREWAASMPMYNAWGGYSVKLEGNSETIAGFGLYGEDLSFRKTHRPVLIWFEWVEGEEPPPTPSPEPPPTPSPEPQPTPSPEPSQVRLVTDWMEQEEADKILAELQRTADFLKSLIKEKSP